MSNPESPGCVIARAAAKAGEYQGFLPNNMPGRWQVRLTDPQPTVFPFTVALPPLHELDDAPMAAEALRTAASVSGGRFYQEENLRELARSVQPRETLYTVHQEVLLWGPLRHLKPDLADYLSLIHSVFTSEPLDMHRGRRVR